MVYRIAKDRMIDVCEMNAYLMCATCSEAETHQCQIAEASNHFILCDSMLPSCHHSDLLSVRFASAQACDNRSRFVFEGSPYQGPVFAPNRALGELLGKVSMGSIGLRYNHQSRRILVQSMNDAGSCFRVQR